MPVITTCTVAALMLMLQQWQNLLDSAYEESFSYKITSVLVTGCLTSSFISVIEFSLANH